MSNQPDLTKFRGAIFWDTAIENIDFTAGSVPFSVSAAISTKPVSFGYRCKVS